MKTLIILMFVCYNLNTRQVNSFNFSPKPNFIFKDPNLKTHIQKSRSSYFGYSIVLREKSILIGAPRSQSAIELQRKINEPGAIYKCSLDTKQCIPYILDSLGNIIAENSEYTYDSEKKDYQWLGATMDGSSKENDRFVACAPRLIANLTNDYLMHGVCYWVQDTIADRPIKVKKISPLRLKADQVKEINNVKYFYYMFGEQGLSAHITENNKEILIGAPGIHTWKGSIIRYMAKIKEDVGGLSRRDSDFLKPLYENDYERNKKRIQKRETIEYVSEIPNPDTWDQPNDSYFGYAVTSGYFINQQNQKQLLYIASAPQAAKQSGEVYLFDIVKNSQGLHTIKKYYTFNGQQFGEFFGYAVLTEDINNDGQTDVIVSAPLYGDGNNYDKGAVYVFLNKGRFQFDNPKIITIKNDTSGSRFGTTLSKLGDINHDGYNDIAIGAPFEGNGSVYIFLGGNKGVRDTPSQILKFPLSSTQNNEKDESDSLKFHAMFGHGISRGVDIDQNGFNDLAIGAPNSEVVYLYKSYPVITIIATVKALSREMKIDQTKLQLSVCYEIETTTPKIKEQEIIIKLKADQIHKRIQFTATNTNEMSLTINARTIPECRLIDAHVQFNLAHIFKPIEIEMQYKLKNEIQIADETKETQEFCDKCAVVNPSSSSFSTEKISFSTGCKDECVADLKIQSSGLNPSFVIGSSPTIIVNYEITNSGENAYLPQINVTSSNRMPFARIPPNCEQEDYFMICDLFNKRPMVNGDKDSISISFDATNIEGDNIYIQAEVFSTGKEKNADDNEALDFIELREVSDIEISGQPNPATISLEKGLDIVEITNTYEIIQYGFEENGQPITIKCFSSNLKIRNHGPSKIKEMNISVTIPTTYQLPNSEINVSIIDFDNIQVISTYFDRQLNTDFYQNNIILLLNPIEVSSSTFTSVTEDLLTSISETLSSSSEVSISHKRKRDTSLVSSNIKTDNNKEYENYQIEESELMESDTAKLTRISNLIGASLPMNKTILFNCEETKTTNCIRSTTTVYDFEANPDKVLNVTIKFKIDLNDINKILVKPLEFFVITTDLFINKVGDKSDSLQVTKTIAHNIISKHQLYSTPLWVYIVSIIGGILVLVAITYALYKYGFFKRTKREELQKLHRQSQIHQLTEENLDDDEGLSN